MGQGMVYLCDGQPNVFEPSAINLTLPIGTPATGFEAQLPYFPSYDALNPAQRGAYIEWLAAGRRDADPKTRELGYLFLFFYGLERRVLVDEDFSVEIGNEIADLIRCYGSSGRSKSMPTYFSQLMHFWAFHQGPETYAELWPQILDVSHSVLGNDELQMVLGSLGTGKQNAPSRIGREVAFNEPDAVRSNVIWRSPEEFRALFDQRFANIFPNGVPLRLGQRPVLARYGPASAALRNMAYNESGRFVARTTYVSIEPTERRKLINIWNSCCKDLSGYVRVKAKAVGKDIDLATLIAAPPELRGPQVATLSGKMNEFLASTAKDGSFHFTPGSSICAFFGVPEREKYTLSQSKQIAEALECIGWSIEPDPRIHNATIGAHQELALFQGTSPVSSPGFLGHCALVQMAATIAASDGGFDLQENKPISTIIDSAAVPDSEKNRLRAWATLLGRDLKNAPTTILKVAKAVPAEKSLAVAQMLCQVATADSVVTKNEERALQRIFRCLKLSDEATALIKKELDGFSEVRVTSGESKSADGEVIPMREPPPPWRKYKTGKTEDGEATPRLPEPDRGRLALDQERIRKLTEETAEVIGILSVAMADTGAEAEKVPTTHPQMFAVPPGPPWAEGLDSKFVQFAAKLAERETWSRAEFNAAAGELKLMPGAAYDAINEWSDGSLGDFLLEGDDPIHVNRHLIPA